MLKIYSAIVVILLCIQFGNSAQAVKFICENVDIVICSSGYRYRTVGSFQTLTLNSTYCLPPGQTCVPKNSTLNLQSCKIDYKNAACSTGVCFMQPTVPICTNDLTCGTQEAPKTYTANYSCDYCNDATTCVKCLYVSTNKVNSTGQTTKQCLGAVCTQGLSNARTTVGRCAGGVDSFGQICECCVTTIQIARFCTSNSPALSQAEVSNWFKTAETPSNTTTTTKAQFKIGSVLLSIILLALNIIY